MCGGGEGDLFYESPKQKVIVHSQVHELFLTYTDEKHARKGSEKELCYLVQLIRWNGLLILKFMNEYSGSLNCLLE